MDKLADFFENEFIIIVALDRTIGESARGLMQARYPGLKPPDAVHVASALAANVDEMHSFDKKLLDLDEKLTKLDGKPLKVCKPSLGGSPLPLLESPPQVLKPLLNDEQGGSSTEKKGPEPAEPVARSDAQPILPADRDDAEKET